jgi:hypothetical protein
MAALRGSDNHRRPGIVSQALHVVWNAAAMHGPALRGPVRPRPSPSGRQSRAMIDWSISAAPVGYSLVDGAGKDL